MMKKILLSLIFSFFLIFSIPVSAQEETPSPTTSPTPSTVKYVLPYPGMLPDSPFYKLKVLRDKIILKLIQDPMKKAEYHLSLTDKGINASKILADKREIALAKETALKGENEFTLLVFEFRNKGKKPNKALFEKLELAALKHQEVLSSIATKLKGEDKKTFETIIEFSQRNADELKKIYHTKPTK